MDDYLVVLLVFIGGYTLFLCLCCRSVRAMAPEASLARSNVRPDEQVNADCERPMFADAAFVPGEGCDIENQPQIVTEAYIIIPESHIVTVRNASPAGW